MNHKGDAGKFRKALIAADLKGLAYSAKIYNDKRKDGTRRLKLWDASTLTFADAKECFNLGINLQKQFGKRLDKCYFVKSSSAQFDFPGFAVVLKN